VSTGPGPDAGASSDLLSGLLGVVTATRPDADAGLISRAYQVAACVHAGQMRKTGDPYITHPVAVAAILAEAGADDQTLCAALLHDALECAGYSLAALRGEFGGDVAGLVTRAAGLDAAGLDAARLNAADMDAADMDAAGVNATEGARGPGGSADGSAARTDATADSGAVMIKLADRLHNLRTAAPLPVTTRLSKSAETLEVLVPLAGSLGLHAIRAELEDLAARTLSSHGLYSASLLARRLLSAAATLLPRAARSRWRDEWAGELSALPTRRQQAVFAARTLAGIPRLAATLRRSRQPGGRP
jgi:(p)ppGpp synthase/HD superfamily hydrolase